jgi:ABC-type ATPase involved in cell division
MLQSALNLELVTLPEAPAWPAPWSLVVALNEVVLIEGVDPAAAEPLLEVAATLKSPVAGKVRHWGLNPENLPREDLYQLRSRMAYISPRQVLLRHLSLGENIALAASYRLGCSEAETLIPHADLLEFLNLKANLDRFPAQVSAAAYHRAVWARELLKEPELILVSLAGFQTIKAGASMWFRVLKDYLARRGAAAVMLGESLEPYYPIGQRLLRLEGRQLVEKPILEHRPRPLTDYLPLV